MKDRVNEIKNAIIEYCKENLNEQYKNTSLELLSKLQEKDEEVFGSSRCDIWVASILNIVLEDDEMFKRKHPMYITKKDFSAKTGVSSKTIKVKSELLRELLEKEVACEEVQKEDEQIQEDAFEQDLQRVKSAPKKELTEEELRESKYKALMGLAHENLPFEDRLEYIKQAMYVALEMIDNKETTVNFWDNETARPYMNAAQDLAILLADNNMTKEAIKYYEMLLQMDDKDVQGNRYKLINLLIKINDRKGVNDLFAKFKDDESAVWDYFKALYYFKNGNRYFAKNALRDGVHKNKYIGILLMGWGPALATSRSYVDPVLYTEATYYYNENYNLWKDTKGALKWILPAIAK